MNRPEPVFAHMRVALSRGEIGVAEEFLDHTKVRPTIEEMGGERVPEGMGMGRTRGASIHDPPDVAWSQRMQASIDEGGGRRIDKGGADNVDPSR